MPADALGTLDLVRALACAAVALSTLELLACGRRLAERGPCAPVHSPGLALMATSRQLRQLAPGDAWFRASLVVRLVLCVLAGAGWLEGLPLPLALWTIVALKLLEGWWLPYGQEAADQVTSMLLTALGLAALAPESVPVQQACTWFVAGQGCAAYATSGVAKLFQRQWRSGQALAAVAQSEAYGIPGMSRFVSVARLALPASWVVMIFEAAFPLALVTGPWGALAFCTAAAVFHVTNAVVMGLNTFVWAFAATWPAVVYCAVLTSGWLAR